MEEAAERAAKVGTGQAGAPGPDWGTLPDAALLNILQRVSLHSLPAGVRSLRGASCSYFLVCKRWWAVAKEAQLRFEPRDSDKDRGSLLLRGIAQFPNLTSVELRGRNISDVVLGFLGGRCSKLIHLTLGRSFRSAHDASQDLSGLTPAGLATALESLSGLQSLYFGISFPLPDSISSLQKLEDLTVYDARGPLPDTLGALASLKKLTVIDLGLSGGPPISPLPASVCQLTGLESLTLNMGFRQSVDDSFTTLEETLSHLCILRDLRLHGLYLRALPASVTTLQKLRILHLDAYFLDTLPPCLAGESEAGQTLRLEELGLDGLRHELTGGLSCLRATLRSLTITRFSHILPCQLGGLSRLQHLELVECSAAQYFPETFYDLTSLQELRVHSCKRLEILPRELRRFPNLKVMSVSYCPRLKSLPEDIGSIPTLREVHLSRLRSLTHLPQSLVNARELKVLRVDDCPRAAPFPGLLQLPSLDEPSRNALREAMHL